MIKKSHSYLYIILTHIVGNTNTLGLGWTHFYGMSWPGCRPKVFAWIELGYQFGPNLAAF